MVSILKIIFIAFMIFGAAVALYGAWEIMGTLNFVNASPGRSKATFLGYHQEIVKTRSSSPSPNWPGQVDFYDSESIMSYPMFEYMTKDGQTRQVLETKNHVFERFKRGQEVEIILSPHAHQEHRLGGFYSLYFRDLCIFVLGCCFILIPFLIWKGFIPLLQSAAGAQLVAQMEEWYRIVISMRVGPITVGGLLKGCAGFIIIVLLISLVAYLDPFYKQLHLGTGWGLIKALEQKRFDEARKMITQKKGINKKDDYNRNPLLLALEANQPELARMLIEAGADVNIKSKMYMTPLRVATQSGDLPTVKLLLSRGASPDAPEDEFPPLVYALIKGEDEIARVLVEGGTNLHRQYRCEDRMRTVGDIAVRARKPELVQLILQRGGTFTE